MNVLDSHLEALAINYVRFGFFTLVNNLWTWVAVVTATVSFWRLRAAGSASTSCPLESHSADLNADGSQPALKLSPPELAADPEPPSSTASASETVVSSVCDCDVKDACAVTKGRFTVYYGEDSESESRLTEEWNNGGGFDIFGMNWELETVVRMRMGDDMGWYRFQDLTVLNGNVVRLWDGCRMRSSTTTTTTTTLGCVMW